MSAGALMQKGVGVPGLGGDAHLLTYVLESNSGKQVR